ncbi:MAG TPA: FAD-dependent oxidoreductase, partial [Ramlibacter sp.]
MRVVVLGTGIVGASCGAWLQRDGHTITFVAPVPPGEACSFGNAGSLSPSACLPVGMPGMWKQVPGWLLDPDGALRIRPSYLPIALPWLLRFLRASSRSEVTRIATALRGLLAPIFESYGALLDHAGAQHLVRRTGCLYVYSSAESARRWRWGMDLRRSLGCDMRDVGEEELAALEPDLKGRFRFGILAPENGSTLDPQALVKAIHDRCVADGAQSVQGEAASFERRGDRITAVVLQGGRRLECDGAVVAAGAWSASLAHQLGARVPLETQRGYHVTVQSNNLALRHT